MGPGVRNEHYSSKEEYMMAVAEACREEYKTITDAGLIVQVDEPGVLHVLDLLSRLECQ